jgi:3-oxoacyl-[acyl-carrier-protein] synthase-3
MGATIGRETITCCFPDETAGPDDFRYLASVTPADLRGPAAIRRLRHPRAAEMLAEAVARRALDRAGLAAGDLDLILTQNIGGQLVMPGLATHVHYALGARRPVPAWNLQTSCASLVDGCELARNLVLAGNYRRILLVTVTALHTGGWGVDQSTPIAIGTGDGAGACIVSDRNVEFEILAYANRTYGEIYSDCAIDCTGTENPELLAGLDVTRNACGLRLTPAFFDWATGSDSKMLAVEVIGAALAGTGLSIADLDLVIPHQVLKPMADIWADGLTAAGLRPGCWRDTWDQYGNVGAVDIAATLSGLVDAGAVRDGALIAFFAPGAGGHTPAMIVRRRAPRGARPGSASA